jgi:uncharacterized protein
MTKTAGHYDKTRAGLFRNFTPNRTCHRLNEVNLEDLRISGKKLILLDVDHTIVPWKKETFSEEILYWIYNAKELGFHLCILSNTRHPERLQRIAEKLDVKALRGKFKPNPQMYHEAMKIFSASRDETIMIGDQIMTDILGAGRSGIDSIWLSKMSGPEFFGTKFNRLIELIIKKIIQKAYTEDAT